MAAQALDATSTAASDDAGATGIVTAGWSGPSAPMNRLGAGVTVTGISHAYAGSPAVSDVSFTVSPGKIAALLGPSGCGKSTMLRIISGLVRQTAGTVRLGDRDVTKIPARDRNVGMVFQNYALFPHMTVRENIGYGLSPLPKAERKERVDELLALVRLESFADRLPRQLSGGQQQRVAVARAIAPRPSLLLLDEPFAALDRALRADMQFEFVRLQRNLGITAILVTHDQEEAQAVADDLIVMNAGKVEQIGSPAQVYDHPQSLFVNGFVGQASVLRATVEGSEGGGTIIRLGTGDTLVLPSSTGYSPGSRVVVAIRPEHVRLESGAAEGAIGAIRTLSVPQGHLVLHDLLLSDGTSLKAVEQRVVGSSGLQAPRDVFVTFDRNRCRLFPAS